MTPWLVFLLNSHIDTVHFCSSCDADYVRNSLVNHDGYDPQITVVKRRELTFTQKHVIATLRSRGDDFTANATENAWLRGASYYLDRRNSARKGLLRKFKQGNKEATQ